MKVIIKEKMKVYLTILMVFFGSSCSGLKTTIAESGIDVSNNGLSKKNLN